jgi:hypothetical protein
MAEENYDNRNVPAALDQVPSQLIPMADHLIWVLGYAEDFPNRPVIFWTFGFRVIFDVEAVAQK